MVFLFSKKLARSLVILLTFALILSSFGMGVFAKGKGNEAAPIQLAELFGEHDLTSSNLTTVIVELNSNSIVEAKHKGLSQSKANLANERGKVINSLKGKVNNALVNREYDYVFSGFSVELPANQIPQLLATPGVKAVYPNVTYTVDAFDLQPVADDAVHPNMMESAPFIGANEAWATGFTGEGVTVAIIDTGVDYTHPDLAHAFGDYKGYDFVNDDNDPQEGPGQTHGTHVAGTVAANGLIKGVAPDANLLGYRVLGPNGGTTQDVVAGVELAVKDGADIMNLSLGNSLNNPDWATSIALDWAMAEGVVAVTSNGNAGPKNWTVGSPGTSREAISVGATQLPYNVFSASLFTSEAVSYPTSKVMGFQSDEDILNLDGNTYEYVYVGLGEVKDFEGLDLTGKIALISRGAIAFVEKAENAANAGAEGAIIFNHQEGEIPFVIPGMAVPTLKLDDKDGQKMLSELESGNNRVTINIDWIGEIGETVADFSSRGPVTSTWMIKPDVSAPGVNILSTVPGGYGAKQGTSMSSPHVAGAAALLLQAQPSWGTQEVKSALMNTAKDLIDPATGTSYPHNTQGAGSIRVVDALNTSTLVLPGSHSFGKFVKDNGKQVEKQSFEIKNLSNETKRYSFTTEFAGDPEGIKVMLSNNLLVPANSTQKVNFNVEVDTSKLDPGYYEGTITVSDGSQTIELPTILFVGEPDYPRVTGAFLGNNGDGTYYVGAYLPGGAEFIQYNLFEFNGGIGPFIGTLGKFTNAPAPFHEFTWDGKINGSDLPNGDYVLAVYVEQAGVTEYKAYLVTKN